MEPTEEQMKIINEKTGDFVLALAEFITDWTIANIAPGDHITAMAVIPNGAGVSLGLFCKSVSNRHPVKASTLAKVVTTKMISEIATELT